MPGCARVTVQPSYGIRLFLRDFKTPPEPLEGFLDREGENRQKHIVRYDPRNLSRVFLYDERIEDHHEIRCDPTLPAITLDEHEEARRALSAQRKLDVDAYAIAKHVMEARALVEQARLKTRRARRQIEDRRSAVQAASTPMLDYAAPAAPTALLYLADDTLLVATDPGTEDVGRTTIATIVRASRSGSHEARDGD